MFSSDQQIYQEITLPKTGKEANMGKNMQSKTYDQREWVKQFLKNPELVTPLADQRLRLLETIDRKTFRRG